MGNVTLAGATSGQITLSPPSVAGTNTLSLPAATGTLIYGTQPSGTIVGTIDTQTLTNKTLTSPTITGAAMSSMASSVITSGTSQASTSGTSIDFTGIPSWVKRITVMFNGNSTNGASPRLIQFGTSGGIVTTNYQSLGSQTNGGGSSLTASTAGFIINATAATHTLFGSYIFSLLGSNVWVGQGIFNDSSATNLFPGSGLSTLTLALTTVRITNVNGTDTFDAGSINILYE